MWHNVDTERSNYVICMYIRLSSEDDDIRYNEMKDESNSITAQRRMLYDYINSRKISKDEYLLQSKEHKQKKQALAEELEKLKIGKKKKESDTSSDMVEMLLEKFSEAEELTNEIKSVMIEKVLVYGNNALEIYWKPDFAKYFELRIGIVPEHVIHAYCESWFPGMEILDFMNLPYEQDEYEAMLSKITWLEEEQQELVEKKQIR